MNASLLLFGLVLVLCIKPSKPQPPPSVTAWINEFHYDNTGTDANEFIEIAHVGGPVTNFRVVLYNGNDGAFYSDRLITSTTFTPPGTSYTVLTYPVNGIQNGASSDTSILEADGIALVSPNGVVVDFLSYEGVFTPIDGPAARLTPFNIGIREIGSTPLGQSLQKCPNLVNTWTGPLLNSAGFANANCLVPTAPVPTAPVPTAPTPTAPTPSIIRIHAIQGTGAPIATPYAVKVSAIVTALFRSADVITGCWIQEEDVDADTNPLTSEGIFVKCGSICPPILLVGDKVEVVGLAGESFTTTQIDVSGTSGASIVIISSGNPLPTPFPLTLPALGSTKTFGTFAHVEGMIVTFPPLVVSEYFELARYGQLVLTASSRPFQFTQLNSPSVSGFSGYNAALEKVRIFLDDDNDDQYDAITGANDTPYFYPSGGLSASNKFRGGDAIINIQGVMQHAFGAWRLRPIASVNYAFAPTNPVPLVPDPVGGTLRVASFNLLNYFTTFDSGGTGCGPNGTLECRGANTLAEFARQQQKLVRAISGLNPDIVGLVELQNSASSTPISNFVTVLNGLLGSGTYAFIQTGLIGGDAIQVGLIYKPSVVRPVNSFKILNSSIDPNFVDTLNRPVLIQTFEKVDTFGRFTVSVVHLKSKNPSTSCDADAGDGQGACAQIRRAAALSLGNYLASDPTGSGDSDHLIIGDFNAYSMEDAISVLETNFGFRNLASSPIGSSAYSYVFDGQLGSLDHALASPTLLPQVTGVTDWHINADEIPLFDYNDSIQDSGEAFFDRKSSIGNLFSPGPLRSSDHDPVLIGMTLSYEPPTLPPSRSPSEAPSESPTESPTESPSESPTEAPTEAPSESPTDSPTESPSESPTDSPTESPSESPTDSPTESPSESPTETPSESPTESPTESPSESPSASPTKNCPIAFHLYNSANDKFVAELTNGVTIVKPPPCGKANIEAVLSCTPVDRRVTMELWRGSRRVQRRIENIRRYFLFGNDGSNVYDGKIVAGRYGIRTIVDNTTSPFTNFTLGGNCS